MSEDSRIVKLETQMNHLESDVTELKGDMKWLVREFGSFRTDVATRFGNVDTRLESIHGSIERNTRWLMGAGIGALATLFGFLGRALKWF